MRKTQILEFKNRKAVCLSLQASHSDMRRRGLTKICSIASLMKNSIFRVCQSGMAAILFAAAPAHVLAQTVDEIPVSALLQQARKVLNLIDSSEASAVWDDSSPVMQQTWKREDFSSRIKADREDVGMIKFRDWNAISQDEYASENALKMPPGKYVSIRFLARDEAGHLLQELISFRLETMRQWRMTGYVSQKVTAR